MKTGNVPRRFVTRFNSLILVGVFMILAAVVAVPFHTARSSSLPNGPALARVPSGATARGNGSLTVSNPTVVGPWASTFSLPVMSSATVAIFASNCSTPQTVFHPGDTVCATVTGATPGWQLIWSSPDSQNTVVQTDTISSDPQNITLVLAANAARGGWRAIVYDPSGGIVYAVAGFTVSDPQNPLVDVQVSKSQRSSQTSVGAQVVFSIQVANSGPDNATNVQLTDAVPANTTFVSFSQLSGPVFSCTNPSSGTTGTTVCTVPTLQNGDIATFVATYLVGNTASAGSTIDNTATVSTSTSDSNSSNDSSTASVPVMSSPCVLTCPSNITQNADSGQSGAVVTYSDPTHTGDCGTDTVDPETGNTIPAISCSPASGSFFDLGTSTVVCSSQTGTECTFQVTIVNPGNNGLTITLNGANPFTLECGTDFVDPGATAQDNTNPNVPVTVSGSVNSHQPGSYTLTYSATDGGDSVSTTRTVNVGDTAPPIITLNGANPLNVSCGDTFTDPGASANDACEGPEAISSSNNVNPSAPGSYTITYTASDSQNHTTTATRTVNVQPSTPSTTTPADQTVCQGATATFQTTTSGSGPFHYAWTLDGSAIGTDSPTVTVDSTTLSIGSHAVAVTVSSACGSTTKNATLTVQQNTSATAPADQTVCQGATASFSTTATGTNIHYSWTLDGSTFGGDSSSISVDTTGVSVGSHAVSVTVSGACGSVTKNATLTVQANTTATAPADQTVCKGATASFSTTASGTNIHYAWTLDGSSYNGDSPSISVPTGSLSAGNHPVTVTVSGTCGTVTKSATLTVNANTATTKPNDQSVCQGSTASFSTTASGTGPFSFVWKKGAVVLHSGDLGGRVTITSGSTSSTLTISNVQPGDAGSYTVETTGSCGTASQSATLSVNSTGPVIVLKTFHGHHDGEDGEGDQDEDSDGPPNVIWPPNHKYHKIKVTNFVASASDSCDSNVNINSVVIDKVTSDEAENAPGSGNTLNDIVIACNRKSVKLRAERIGGGNGRVYTITFKVTNQYGVSSTATVKVYVPKDDDHETAVDDGPHYTVTSATCP
jgi:uncharacterized repeat protein (TIGR01451 family)